MKKYTLSNPTNSLEVSQITLGHLFMNLPQRTEASYGYMEEFLEFGGNTFDNARVYGDWQSERFLGEFFKRTGKRHEMVITTKCGHHNKKTWEPRLDPYNLNADVDTSLTMLGTDYIDILYLHRDDIFKPVEEIMVALDKIVKSGKARVLGASNWTAPRIQKANDFANKFGLTPFSVSQINYSAAITTPAATDDTTQVVMDLAEKSWYADSKMLLMPWAPNARGFFSQVINNGEPNARTKAWYGWCSENYRRADRFKYLSEKMGYPVGSVVLAYLLCQPDVDVTPIIAFTKREQFEESKLALDIKLSKQDIAYIDGKYADFSR